MTLTSTRPASVAGPQAIHPITPAVFNSNAEMKT